MEGQNPLVYDFDGRILFFRAGRHLQKMRADVHSQKMSARRRADYFLRVFVRHGGKHQTKTERMGLFKMPL